MKNNRRNSSRGPKGRSRSPKVTPSQNTQPPSPQLPLPIDEAPVGKERSRVRDMGILAAWIAGLCLAGGLAWFLTQPLRSSLIIHTVNRTLERSGENRRLEAQISPWGKSGAAFQLGSWYTLREGNDRVVVFSIMNDGILAPYAAFISRQGVAESFIPLSAHADRLLGRLPLGILQTYVRRIESAEKEL